MLADRVRMKSSGFDGAISRPATLFNGNDVSLVEEVNSQFVSRGGYSSEVKSGYIEITVSSSGLAIYKITSPVNLSRFTKVTFKVQLIDLNFASERNKVYVFATTKGELTDIFDTDGKGDGWYARRIQKQTALPNVKNGTWTVDVDISSFNNKEDLYVGGLGAVETATMWGTMRISNITIS